MSQQVVTKTFDEEIRERLRTLVKTRSQSDLARKTATLVSTVNRYLKSTKIPGEFCTAVINGLGVNPATPTWGLAMNEGRDFIRQAWWISVFPGLAIVTTVMALNLFGDGLRDAFDPGSGQLRRRKGASR